MNNVHIIKGDTISHVNCGTQKVHVLGAVVHSTSGVQLTLQGEYRSCVSDAPPSPF